MCTKDDEDVISTLHFSPCSHILIAVEVPLDTQEQPEMAQQLTDTLQGLSLILTAHNHHSNLYKTVYRLVIHTELLQHEENGLKFFDTFTALEMYTYASNARERRTLVPVILAGISELYALKLRVYPRDFDYSTADYPCECNHKNKDVLRPLETDITRLQRDHPTLFPSGNKCSPVVLKDLLHEFDFLDEGLNQLFVTTFGTVPLAIELQAEHDTSKRMVLKSNAGSNMPVSTLSPTSIVLIVGERSLTQSLFYDLEFKLNARIDVKEILSRIKANILHYRSLSVVLTSMESWSLRIGNTQYVVLVKPVKVASLRRKRKRND